MASEFPSGYWRYTNGEYADLPANELARRQAATYSTEDVIELVDGRLMFLTGAVEPVETEHEGYFLEGIECNADFLPTGNSPCAFMGLDVVRTVGHVSDDPLLFLWMDANWFIRDRELTPGLLEKLPEGPLRRDVIEETLSQHNPARQTASPYIPAEHAKLDLLPGLRIHGGETITLPQDLEILIDVIVERDQTINEADTTRILPFGYKAYANYFNNLSSLAEHYEESDPELSDLIVDVSRAMQRANTKELWSVVRYVGPALSNKERTLTPGRCYYWPTSPDNPVYQGVIDDSEILAFIYPCDADHWEIIRDPLGMAARALAGEFDVDGTWGNFLVDFGEVEGDPLSGKRQPIFRIMPDYERHDAWGASEQDPVDFACPSCGSPLHMDAWTKINVRNDPKLARMIDDGSYCEFTCPTCGYKAHLAHPTLYLDPANNACIYLVADEAMRKEAEEMFDGLAHVHGIGEPGSGPMRIVTTREELREKAVIFACGYDDRVVELLKLGVAGQVMDTGIGSPDSEYSVRFLQFGYDAEKGKLTIVFRITFEGLDASFTTNLPDEAYDLLASDLANSPYANDQGYYVDRQWAYDHYPHVEDD